MSRSKHLRSTNSWLERVGGETPNPREAIAHTAGCLTGLLGVPLAGLGIGMAFGLVPGLIAAVVAIPVSLGAWFVLARRAGRPRSEEEARQIQRRQAVHHLRGLKNNRKLHKHVDPQILQVMEAAAYHWLRIHEVLDAREWRSKNLSGHWKSLREQALHAADQAMQDIAVYAQSCIGKPNRERKDDLEEIFEDFFDGDFSDALGGLKSVMTSDWRDYSHHSPNAQAVFEPSRQIAERLKMLADEVDQMNLRRTQETVEINDQPEAVDSIDLILNELRATKQAEEELGDDDEYLHQGI